MIQKKTCENGVVVYRSTLLDDMGVLHGFSTRVGGMSPARNKGDYDGLDLGVVGDERDGIGLKYIAANFRKLRKAVGMQRMIRREIRQVHGGEVYVWKKDEEPVGLADAPAVDGMVTRNAGEMLTIRTADCTPVLLAGKDAAGQIVIGAVHAGWRGVVDGVIGNAIQVMEEMGANASGIVSAIGPCIGVDVFEVGNEVVEQFERAKLGSFILLGSGQGRKQERAHIDLRSAVWDQLVRAGMSNGRIDVCDICTYERADEFYSYRRVNECGRMAAVIGICKK